MARGIIGKKLGMTQVFDAYGNMIAATAVGVEPNHVIQIKTTSGRDGYNAIKVGTGAVKATRVNLPDAGVFKAVDQDAKRIVGEFRLDAEELAHYSLGESFGVTLFTEGDTVDVTGTSKGRGFAGVMKRHHFKGAKERTHGTHEYKRHGGSIGCSAYPGRVVKGKRMAGHMGNKRVTVLGLEVIGVFEDKNVILVKGAIPGPKNGTVRLTESAR